MCWSVSSILQVDAPNTYIQHCSGVLPNSSDHPSLTIRPFTISHCARGLVKPRTMPHLEVDKRRNTWQYARHDSIHSPVRFSFELQQAQAFRKMVILVPEAAIGGIVHGVHGWKCQPRSCQTAPSPINIAQLGEKCHLQFPGN